MMEYKDLTHEEKQTALDEAWKIMNPLWALKLKEGISKRYHGGVDLYLSDNDWEDFMTNDVNDAELYEDKEAAIKAMKSHEAYVKRRYGDDAVCNFGYTNIMRNFDFVQVELIGGEVNE